MREDIVRFHDSISYLAGDENDACGKIIKSIDHVATVYDVASDMMRDMSDEAYNLVDCAEMNFDDFKMDETYLQIFRFKMFFKAFKDAVNAGTLDEISKGSKELKEKIINNTPVLAWNYKDKDGVLYTVSVAFSICEEDFSYDVEDVVLSMTKDTKEFFFDCGENEWRE